MRRFVMMVAVVVFMTGTGFGQAGRFKEKIRAATGTTNDQFGSAVGIDGDWAVIGAPKNAETNGRAFFFLWNGTNWDQQADVLASDGAAYDQFGESVAIAGDWAVIGATRPYLFPASPGKAYFFERSGTDWTEQDSVTAGDDTTLFGEAVDIDGDYAIVGDRLGENGMSVSVGLAYIYKRSGSSWGLEATLSASDGVDSDWFGHAVAINGDYAIIGANGRSNFIGGAYIFKRDGALWNEVAILNDPDDTLNDLFGGAVDISDGWALVGSRHDTYQGAYLYRLDGTNWTFHAGLPDIYGRGDFYGQDVALTDPYALVGGGEHAILWKRREADWIKQVYLGGGADDWNLTGTRLAVHRRNLLTGHNSDDTLGENAGAAWALPVNDRNRQSELIPTNNGLHYIGSGVAVDGRRALVGADQGSVAQDFGYCGVFVLTGQYWLADAQLIPADAADNMQFGSSAALAGDYALVGAMRSTNAAGLTVGSAYVFWNDGTHWAQQAKLTDAAPHSMEDFGQTVETDGRYAFVAAPFYDSSDGKVVVYERQDTNWMYAATLPDPLLNTALFGWDIGFDGARFIAGSPQEYEAAFAEAGAAYIYALESGGTWTNEARVAASAPSAYMKLGEAVDIDDDWAVCGAPREDAPTNQCGAIYLFQRTGGSWIQQARIPAPEVFTNGYFGSAVAIRKPYLLACANGTDARRAYLFKQDGTNWNLLTRLYPGDGDPSEAFGSRCDMSENHALIGLNVQDGRKAYMYWQESWDQMPQMKALTLENGSLCISLTNLPIGPTVVVQRVSNLIDEPINWTDLVEINPPKPETNGVVIVEPTNLVEAIRLLTYPESPENQ